ncbi:ShlB/FhaC/HecB family hemolysin secretion/activation protein [Marinobacter sp.]|uniref:ShlB/FhaC/HecB family hemolysin secretion/activation protein n=1 Tax=Marinobacter sp. TaxID=50741 RepID=UPI00356968E3
MASLTYRYGKRRLRALIVATLLLAPATGTWAGTGSGNQAARTLSLLQQSLHWIREQHGRPAPELAGPRSGIAQGDGVTVPGMATAAIPLSSAPARENWAGQRFFLRGEDHSADQTDRVRVGFEESRVPWLGSDLTVEGNWSVSQQPADTTMDIGLDWQVPLGRNRLSFSGRHHEYQDEVIAGDDVRQVGGNRQTLELDFSRNLYQGRLAGLDARVITRDISTQWFENDDLTGEARRSYSLLRLDGHLGGQLPWLDARGDLNLSVEGCTALLDGAEQEACGERLGAFQRYNLAAGLERDWLQMDWNLHGAYQFTPDELPGWRYLEVGPGMMHGFGGQVLRGSQGGWVRLDSSTPSQLLWLPTKVRTSLHFSLLRGWTEAPGEELTSRATVGEVLWQVSSDHLSGGLRAGTLLEVVGPGLASTDVPDISLDITWTL